MLQPMDEYRKPHTTLLCNFQHKPKLCHLLL
jgi:hypothetical protein